MKAIAALDRIIGEAHSPIRQPNAKEDKKRSAIEYLHLESVIRLEGEEIHLRVVVERDNNGLLHYDLMIEKSVAEATKALDLESGASDAPRPIPDNHSGGDGAPILDGADEEVKKNAMIINMFFFGEVVDEGEDPTYDQGGIFPAPLAPEGAESKVKTAKGTRSADRLQRDRSRPPDHVTRPDHGRREPGVPARAAAA